MNSLVRLLLSPIRTETGRWFVERVLAGIARVGGVDLLAFSERRIGVGNYKDSESSGEAHLFRNVLPKLLPAAPIVFDVGANVGDYSADIRRAFPTAKIYAFEPNPRTFETLREAAKTASIEPIPVAVGESICTMKLFDYAESSGTQLASLHHGVLTDLHRSHSVSETSVDVITLDQFCSERTIQRIDFLKIDTEGHELAALKGASSLIAADRIGVIQFEFNEMNVVSRSFLLDFYKVLPSHDFYRLDVHRLIPLGPYSSRNEIFRFQNILAVHCSLKGIAIA